MSFRQLSTKPEPPPVGVGIGLTVDALSTPHVRRQISRMQSNIESDSELAIGASKELVETTCKTILERLQMDIPSEVPGLVRTTLDALGLDLAGAEDPVRAQRATQRLLGSLSGLGAGVGEVRNAMGTGHGRHASAEHADTMYARLAVNATATLVTFMLNRYQQVRPEGAIQELSSTEEGNAAHEALVSAKDAGPEAEA